jgi:hypothetical protein
MATNKGFQKADEPIYCAGPPLDYSFKELKSIAELETEDPRSGSICRPTAGKKPGGGDGEDAAPSLASPSSVLAGVKDGGRKDRKIEIRKVTNSIKLSNNFLLTVQAVQDEASFKPGLTEGLGFVMTNPIENLHWLDLSFNALSHIEPEIFKLVKLRALYLHGNMIKSFASVEKLSNLRELMSLTLNGNPIESSKSYRMHVIGPNQHLRSLDHSTITKDEKNSAISWYGSFLKAREERRQRELEGGADY